MANEEAVDDIIRAPAGIKSVNLRPSHPAASGDMTTRTFPPQMEPFLAVNPVGPLMIDAPALAPKQDLNTPISVPNPRLRDLFDPQPQHPVVSALRAIPMR